MGLFDFLRRAFTSTKDLENNKPSGKILNKRQRRDIIGLSDEEIEKFKKEAYEKAMKRSDEFSKIHSNKTKAININNISNSKKDYSPLTPYEILFLDYIY